MDVSDTADSLPSLDKDEEEYLVAGFKAGDSQACARLFDLYNRPLHAFLYRMTGNRESTEDLFQETWIRAVRYSGSFKGRCKFSTWLFQIALNLFRNHHRKMRRREYVSIDDAPTLSDSPDVDADRIIAGQRVRKIIASLPVKLRTVIVLRYYHQLNEPEIAEVVSLPLGTVKTRLFRAYKILREKLNVVYNYK